MLHIPRLVLNVYFSESASVFATEFFAIPCNTVQILSFSVSLSVFEAILNTDLHNIILIALEGCIVITYIKNAHAEMFQ